MNIAVYTFGDFPNGRAGEHFVKQMALGLHQNDLTVEVIRLRGDWYSMINDTPIKRSNYLFKKPFKNDFLKIFELIFIILFVPFSLIYRKVYKKNQIILLYGINYAYLVLPFIFWSKILKLKCYRIITDLYRDQTIAPVWWKKPKLFFYDIQFKYFDKYLNGVIVLSNFLYRLCIKNKVSKNRILLVPHFIDLKPHTKPLSVYIDRNIIGFCGNPSIFNGIIDLIEAFVTLSKYHKNTKLLIIGEVSNEIIAILKKKKLENEDVIFTGFLQGKELINRLLSCAILVNPRKSGVWADAGFPTKLGEYFATQIPVVTTKVGDLPYYFQDKKEVLFAEPDNPKSLSESILFLLNNPEEGSKIGINGYNWASENLDYVKNSKILANFIRST